MPTVLTTVARVDTVYVIDPSTMRYNAYISNVDEVASPGGRVY
jgi:hypothetical protein